jgi:hypothetical protein
LLGESKANNAPTQEWSSREARRRVQRNSLLHYGANIYSQRGDDGIIQEIFRRLKVGLGYFCELGAWDGLHLSNARLLFEQGWSGLFIEGDRERFPALQSRYERCSDIKCLNCFVSADGRGRSKTLDQLCADEKISVIDFLSIDVDGLDLNIFESIQLRPMVVAIEGGFAWHPEMRERVPDDVAAADLQQPLHVAICAAKAKGYEPVCFNQNLYVVQRELASAFGDIIPDPAQLWLDAYYFMSEQFREYLKTFRKSNRLIIDHEGGVRELP